MTTAWNLLSFRAWFALAVLVAITSLAGASGSAQESARPLYPDLTTQTPDNLFFDTVERDDGQLRHVLKFSNVIVNAGQGRLEVDLVGDTADSGEPVIHQNLYDDAVDGEVVTRRPMDAELVYHDDHQHYHLDDFTHFALLRSGADGVYRVSTGIGGKASTCLVDNTPFAPWASEDMAYNSCTRDQQGISAGWADIYYASFPEQWVDLGTEPLPDGHYSLRSTADPDNVVDEGGRTAEINNSAATYFSVQNGALVGLPPAAACTVDPLGGPVGTTPTVSCANFLAGENVMVLWDGGLLSQVRVDADTTSATAVEIPQATTGGHDLVVQGRSSGRETGVLFTVSPNLRFETNSGAAGQPVGAELTGFGESELVQLRWVTQPGRSPSISQALTSETGVASVNMRIPPTAAPGTYSIVATGLESGVHTERGFTVLGPDGITTPAASPVPDDVVASSSPDSQVASPFPSAPVATPQVPHLPEPAVTGVEVMTSDQSSLTLRIRATDAATVAVEYGPDGAHGLAVRASASRDGSFEATIPDLDAETTVHYRVVAVGPGGQTATDDATFEGLRAEV